MGERPDIAIVGPGKVGTAIGILAARAGRQVVAVGGRDVGRARAAAEQIHPSTRAGTLREAASAGELILLTVTDDAIRPLCRELAEAGAFRSETVIAHCSGAMASDVLAPARDSCGCSIGSMHPLQTFPTVADAVVTLPGTYCFTEGDEAAVGALSVLSADIGGKAVRIAPESKTLYHAAAVMACNYLTTLMDGAVCLAESAGIAPADFLPALEPLVRATLRNVLSTGPADALTGPIARGDVETVHQHLEAIADCPEALREFYVAAGKWTVELARKKGSIDEAAARRLRDLFTN